MLYILIAIYIVFMAVQSGFFIKKKLYGELAASLIITIIALLYAMDSLVRWNLPTDMDILGAVFRPFAEMVFGCSYLG